MANKIGTITIEMKVKLSLWSAIKLRIAGIVNIIKQNTDKNEIEEDKDARKE